MATTSILEPLAPNAACVPAAGAFMTCILWGLMERENRTLFHLGLDSVLAALCYAAGMVVLYFIA